MPINVLNKLGPLCFESSTINFSSGSSINSLLENFTTITLQDVSLSASLSELVKRKGNYVDGTNGGNLGTGLINYDGTKQIRFSSFFNASYLSASIEQESDGVVTVDTYPLSIITNNFLTGNSQDQVYKYSLYTKIGTTTPITDANWEKVYSITRSGNNVYNFYGLVDTNSYKITVQDCLSNAFTSSMFVGNCTDTVTTQPSFNLSISTLGLDAAISLIKAGIINLGDSITLTQRLDLMEAILKNLGSVITNSKLFKTQNNLEPVVTYRDSTGYQRTCRFTGLVYQDTNKNYIYNGSVHASSNAGSIPDYYYSFENVNTKGDINLYILGRNVKTGTNCDDPPTKIGYIPSTFYVRGPTCGQLDCGVGKTQIFCNPSNKNQVRHSSSFVITNQNDHNLTVTISNDPNDWTDFSGNSIDGYLTPIEIFPSTPLVIPPKSFKKISIGFGVAQYANSNQPSYFEIRTKANFSLPEGQGYEPRTLDSEFKAIFDKNSCLIGVTFPYLVSQTSNIGNVLYNGKINETWSTIKTKIKNTISYGTFSDKLYANGIISALPSTGCELPTSITEQNVNLTLTWTLVTTSPIQNYVCNDSQFSGTYNVTVNNATYGTSNFYIYFLRKNDNSLGAYINLTQLGGTSNPF